MVNADLGGGSAHDVRRAAESLKNFKARVDGILERLEASAASRTRLSANVVPRASYGTGFGEAEALSTQYDRVHHHLTTLSQTFGDQIDAMGIAVLGADIGFDNLEEDLKRRFWAIQDRTRQDGSTPVSGGSGASHDGDTDGQL